MAARWGCGFGFSGDWDRGLAPVSACQGCCSEELLREVPKREARGGGERPLEGVRSRGYAWLAAAGSGALAVASAIGPIGVGEGGSVLTETGGCESFRVPVGLAGDSQGNCSCKESDCRQRCNIIYFHRWMCLRNAEHIL